MSRHVDNKTHLGDSVVEIVDYLPHVVIEGLERVHVIPLPTLQDVAMGRLKWSEVSDSDDMTPAIFQEWLIGLKR